MIRVDEAAPPARKKDRERRDVIPVGVHGVGGEAALEMEVVHERFDRPGIRGHDDCCAGARFRPPVGGIGS